MQFTSDVLCVLCALDCPSMFWLSSSTCVISPDPNHQQTAVCVSLLLQVGQKVSEVKGK